MLLLLTQASCVSTRYEGALEGPLAPIDSTRSELGVRSWVDTDRSEIVMTAGPFTVPAGAMSHNGSTNAVGSVEHGGHGAHQAGMKTPLIPLRWPVAGGLRGFRLALFKKDGTRLSRDLIHHLNALPFDRRELLYPIPTRLIAIGSETPDILLPESHQIRVGDTIPGGGMAQIGGLFRPDAPEDWPVPDQADERYRLDLSGIPEPLEPVKMHGR